MSNDDAQHASSGPSNASSFATAGVQSVRPKPIQVETSLESAQRLSETPAADLYPSLRNRADSGDLEAKRQLFLVLNECRLAMQPDRPVDYSSSHIAPDVLKASGKTREQFLAEQQQSALVSTEEKLKKCVGIPGGAVNETARWLEEAAEAGDTYARLTYYNYPDLIIGDPQKQEASPEQIKKFNENSLRYIESVADAGIPDGLFTLGTAYQRGTITPKDPVRAYAYKKAAGELTPIGGNAHALDLMAQSMAPTELEQANQLAVSLVQKSRK